MKNLVKSIWCLLFCLCAGNGWAQSLEPEWFKVKEVNFNDGTTPGLTADNGDSRIFGTMKRTVDAATTSTAVWMESSTTFTIDNALFANATNWKLEMLFALVSANDAGVWFKTGGDNQIAIRSFGNANAFCERKGEANIDNVANVIVDFNSDRRDERLIWNKVTLTRTESNGVTITVQEWDSSTGTLGDIRMENVPVANCAKIDNLGFYALQNVANYVFIDELNFYVGSETVTISEAGVATYCSTLPLDFTNVAGLKAYVAVDADNNAVTMERVYQVPANTGLYLVGDEGSYSVPVATGMVPAVEKNYLVGVTVATPISQTDGDNTLFLLSADGFKKASEEVGTLAAGKAYLELPSSMFGSGVNLLTLVIDGETGIRESVAAPVVDDAIYDLCGRRVEHPVRGIYIQGGKKVLFK